MILPGTLIDFNKRGRGSGVHPLPLYFFMQPCCGILEHTYGMLQRIAYNVRLEISRIQPRMHRRWLHTGYKLAWRMRYCAP